MFKATGIKGVELSLPGCTTVLMGYFPCSKIPQIGFAFPSAYDAKHAKGATSDISTVFNIEPSAFIEAKDGHGNCTATITGIDTGYPGWIVGQCRCSYWGFECCMLTGP